VQTLKPFLHQVAATSVAPSVGAPRALHVRPSGCEAADRESALTPGAASPIVNAHMGETMSKVRCCVVVSLALLSLASRLPDQAATGPDVRRVTVVFRFDDYARWSSRTGAELLALFQKHRIPCTFAVIPQTTAAGEFASAPADSAPIDQETSGKLDDAVREGLLEVALHGYTHADRAALRVSGRDAEQSEFRGLDYSSQLRMLSEGRSTLESLYHVSVTTFIPPWNSYDENTLRALDSLGFKVVSGSGRTRRVETQDRKSVV
jgi:peptidoglycan/xylan/chitin deacetylase (PgdA/CDA1 family)